MKNALAVLSLLVLSGGSLCGDVLITETIATKAGKRDLPGTRSTYIKGRQMRIDLVQDKDSASTLYDLRENVTIALDAKKKRAEVRDVAERSAKLETLYPRSRTTTSVTATGTTREIAGASCADHAFSVRVPMTKDGKLAFMLTGSACIAKDAPGASDYQAFALAAIEQQVVLGPASDNRILLALARGQTELYRGLADLGGIPYVVDMKMDVDGHGMVAGLVRKAIAGSRTSTVKTVATAPLDAATFAVPSGWKRQRK
ncbi:MAG: hypothetical protein A3H96_07630 [Acidobacteria bacterium RIFCSPLOWO2_02_FULL_67_36]|nr:MAG: hypothetical protein A3H96_07630 [Acidobacteria bacterium RIFCSPLOWO2_02_FULL_67_36]OFW23621.1 MAG: hypothetical protein A3G21_06790 [Acidobacteria bacterium RIFCSPLOWO2_12_FULL_66_21]